MIRILVSACLLGEPVRYHGGDALCSDPRLARWSREGRLVPVCPEVEGGLGVPRPAAEIRGGDALAVLDGEGRVVTRRGVDVTEAFLRGGRVALELAERAGVRLAILTDRSPSCGSSEIYDGSFSGVRRRGTGVTAALLERHGIRVFGPDRLDAAEHYLEELERAAGSPRDTR